MNQDKQHLQNRSSQANTANGDLTLGENLPCLAQPYSQAIKLRIEQAQQKRDAEFAREASCDLGDSQHSTLIISCECGVSTSDDILVGSRTAMAILETNTVMRFNVAYVIISSTYIVMAI